MIYIVDGCDKSGKSTVVNSLVNLFPLLHKIKNQFKPTSSTEETGFKMIGIYLGIYETLLQTETDAVLDRGHLTEIVYGHRRGYDSEKLFPWTDFEETTLADNARIIYVSAPPAVIRERFKVDNETYISDTEIEGILERYENYLEKTKLKVLRLSSLDDLSIINRQLIDFIQEYGHLRRYKGRNPKRKG